MHNGKPERRVDVNGTTPSEKRTMILQHAVAAIDEALMERYHLGLPTHNLNRSPKLQRCPPHKTISHHLRAPIPPAVVAVAGVVGAVVAVVVVAEGETLTKPSSHRNSNKMKQKWKHINRRHPLPT